MTTTSRRNYFRRNVGDPGDGVTPTIDVFTNDEIDGIYSDVETDLPSTVSESTIKIAAVVMGLEWIIADAVKQIVYTQNDSRVEGSSVPRRLMEWYKVWLAKLESALKVDLGPAIRTGVTKRIPSRTKEYPDA